MLSLHIAQKKRGEKQANSNKYKLPLTTFIFKLIKYEENLKRNSFMLSLRIGKKGGGE